MTDARVILGLQGVQMPANAIRGIGRWTTEYLRALLAHHPQVLAGISVDPKLPLLPIVSELVGQIPIYFTDQEPAEEKSSDLIFHALSPLEDLPIDRIWPAWARSNDVGLVTTLFDMIPLLFPDDYFKGGLKRLLEMRYDMHRQADAVIAISQTTADDAVRLLGLDPSACWVAAGGVSAQFAPHPLGRAAAAADLATLGIRPDFALTIGNVDPRKNIAALIESYAKLSPEARQRHQLVMTCSQGSPEVIAQLQGLAAEHGVADTTIVLSYVSDDLMLSLYQACWVMIYPSLYEGLGLPLLEALACGAAVMASDAGPMREIVTHPQARFDPTQVSQMTERLAAIDESEALLDEVRAQAVPSQFTWAASVHEAVNAYASAVRA